MRLVEQAELIPLKGPQEAGRLCVMPVLLPQVSINTQSLRFYLEYGRSLNCVDEDAALFHSKRVFS